jgi:hypothetical protein
MERSHATFRHHMIILTKQMYVVQIENQMVVMIKQYRYLLAVLKRLPSCKICTKLK